MGWVGRENRFAMNQMFSFDPEIIFQRNKLS